MRDREVLGGLIGRLGLPATLLSLLIAHARAVQRDAERLGLVSPADIPNIVSRHTADSLLFALARRPDAGERWLDVGSGAGFPGLVLAACFPACAFSLLEPFTRRAGFLELVGADLGLANIEVVAARAETLPGGGFDVAVARALDQPGAATRSMERLVRPGGEVVVAVSSVAQVVAPARMVRVENLGLVDSPGLFSKMTRRG